MIKYILIVLVLLSCREKKGEVPKVITDTVKKGTYTFSVTTTEPKDDTIYGTNGSMAIVHEVRESQPCPIVYIHDTIYRTRVVYKNKVESINQNGGVTAEKVINND